MATTVRNEPGGGMPAAGSGGSSTGYLAGEAARLGVMAGAGPSVGPAVTTSTYGGATLRRSGTVIEPGVRQTPIAVLVTQFDQAPIKRKREMAEKLVRAGYLPPPAKGESMEDYLKRIPLATVRQAYAGLLEDTAQRNASGQPNLTPTDLLEQNIEYGKDFFKSLDGKGAGAGEDIPDLKKQTQTSIDIYSPSQARGLIRNVLMQQLGREPTEDEFADFRDALNDEQRENPVTSTTRYAYDEYGRAVDSTTTSRGGIDEGEYATQWAQSQPGWAEWQAVGTYFPTLLNALGTGVPGV